MPTTNYRYGVAFYDEVSHWNKIHDEMLSRIMYGRNVQMSKYKVGDVLESEHDFHNYTRKIIGIIGDIIVTEDSDDGQPDAERQKTIEQDGWSLSKPVVELTIAEVEAIVGKKVKIVK